jgi:thymidine kinase
MSCHLIVGPMFAGKSTELIRRLTRATMGGKKVVAITYEGDTRYGHEVIATHDKRTFPAIPCGALLSSLTSSPEIESADVVGVDEGQFFTDLLSFCLNLEQRGKTVIVAGLDGDYRREPFGSIGALLPKCTDIVKLTALCSLCGSDAPFTWKRKISSSSSSDSSSTSSSSSLLVIEIGGSDLYSPLCSKCYFIN